MGKNKRRKISRKRRRNRMMRFFLLVNLLLIILLTSILGFFVGRYFYRNIYSQVDIILDAGHGGKDPGANKGDAVEKDITLAIAKMTQENLEDSGYKVKMIRDDDHFIEHTEASDRGVKTADYTVLVRTDMPAVLIETGFLTNSTECELLTKSDYQEKVAQGIAKGIIDYLGDK